MTSHNLAHEDAKMGLDHNPAVENGGHHDAKMGYNPAVENGGPNDADNLLSAMGYKSELVRSRSTLQVAFMSFVLAAVSLWSGHDFVLSYRWRRSSGYHLGVARGISHHHVRRGVSRRDYKCLSNGWRRLLPNFHDNSTGFSENRLLDLRLVFRRGVISRLLSRCSLLLHCFW